HHYAPEHATDQYPDPTPSPSGGLVLAADRHLGIGYGPLYPHPIVPLRLPPLFLVSAPDSPEPKRRVVRHARSERLDLAHASLASISPRHYPPPFHKHHLGC